jgi:hypothetical protein
MKPEHTLPGPEPKRGQPMTANPTVRPMERTSTTIAVVVLAPVCVAWVAVALIHPTISPTMSGFRSF